MISVALTISIFARYVWFDHFPPSAFINIGLTFIFSFFQIGLAATDVAFTKKNRALGNFEAHQSVSGIMSVLWFIVYWGTILTGTVLM